jgi:hypothetical protein
MSKTLIELLSVQFKFFLQQFLVNNLVVCPMYIQGFSVNHKFRHFWKVFRNVFFSFVTIPPLFVFPENYSFTDNL